MCLRIALNRVTDPVDFPKALTFWDTALSHWLDLAFKSIMLALMHPSQSLHVPRLLSATDLFRSLFVFCLSA